MLKRHLCAIGFGVLTALCSLTVFAQEAVQKESPEPAGSDRPGPAGSYLIRIDTGAEQPVLMLAVLNQDGTFQAHAMQPLAAGDISFRSGDLMPAGFFDTPVQHLGAWKDSEQGQATFNALNLSKEETPSSRASGVEGAIIRTSGSLTVSESGDVISGEISQRFFEGSENPLSPDAVPFAELGPFSFTGRRIPADEPLDVSIEARGQEQLDICHIAGKSGNIVQIRVAAPSFPAHQAHGDYLLPTFYLDADADGVGDPAHSVQQCVAPDGYVPAENGEDCNDSASSCTSDCTTDGDGDGRVDCVDQCLDADLDGYGSDNSSNIVGTGSFSVGECTTDGSTACDIGPACLGEDCDDTDAAINPAAMEVCDFVDNNCDGQIDEGFDQDNDGFKTCEGDCNDNDSTVFPGAADAICNGVDNDCDGMTDEGYVSTPTMCGVGVCAATGATMCSSGIVSDTCTPGTPGAELCGDGLDNDCDGMTDEGCVAKTVFVSSVTFDGNFGMGHDNTLGHLAADGQCQTLAGNAGLSGTYKAWISGRVDTGDGPLPHGVDDRFSMAGGPYLLLDGTKVADNWADLTDGSLDHAIDRTELNVQLPGGSEMRVWTNTTTSGQAWDNSTNCALGPGTDGIPGIISWTCGSPDFSPGDCANQSGKFGLANSTTGSWTGTGSSNIACTNMFRLYCFEQ